MFCFSMANLITMFEDVELYLDVRSVRDYIKDIDRKKLEEHLVPQLPKLVALLKEMGKEQNIYEKVEADLKLLEQEAKVVYER